MFTCRMGLFERRPLLFILPFSFLRRRVGMARIMKAELLQSTRILQQAIQLALLTL